jgi:hypothetical protein
MSTRQSKGRKKPIQEAYFSPIRALQCIPQLLVREGPLETLNLQMYVSANNKLPPPAAEIENPRISSVAITNSHTLAVSQDVGNFIDPAGLRWERTP